MPLLIVGCGTSSGDFCQISGIIRPSIADTLTLETKRQILASNEKYSKLCGVNQ